MTTEQAVDALKDAFIRAVSNDLDNYFDYVYYDADEDSYFRFDRQHNSTVSYIDVPDGDDVWAASVTFSASLNGDLELIIGKAYFSAEKYNIDGIVTEAIEFEW